MSSVPTATVSRLVTYLRILTLLEAQGVKKTSSEHLADEAQVSAFQVRKDLAYFGRFGTRGAGYTVPTLRRELRRILGLTRPWSAALVGVGRLGEAILHYPNFSDYDFALKGAFDIDSSKVGSRSKGSGFKVWMSFPPSSVKKGSTSGLSPCRKLQLRTLPTRSCERELKVF